MNLQAMENTTVFTIQKEHLYKLYSESNAEITEDTIKLLQTKGFECVELR